MIHCVGRLLWFILPCVSGLFKLCSDYCVQNICFFVTEVHCITRMCIVRQYCATVLCDSIVRPYCATVLCDSIVRQYCATVLCDRIVPPHHLRSPQDSTVAVFGRPNNRKGVTKCRTPDFSNMSQHPFHVKTAWAQLDVIIYMWVEGAAAQPLMFCKHYNQRQPFDRYRAYI